MGRNMSYEKFIDEVKTYSRIQAIQGQLSWDQQVMMPPNGANARADTLAWLSGRAHETITSKKMGELISDLEKNLSDLDDDQKTNVLEIRRTFDKSTKLPAEFIERFTKTQSKGMGVWAKARKNDDFNMFAPILTELVELAREKITYLENGNTPYDTLLDDYEVGLTVDYLEPLFAELKTGLIEILNKIMKTKKHQLAKLDMTFPVSNQEAFCLKVSEQMGFDFNSGRMDTSSHPFSISIAAGDTRITTRYDENEPFSCLYAVMHETGHGLYEQGLPDEFALTPRGTAISLGVHESQSRLWENQIGRTEEFWKYCLPLFQKEFPEFPKSIDPAQMNLIANQVEPSFIRVEADEVTYNLHIILRYEIEKKLFNGELDVNDLPKVWNEMFKEWFGLDVKDDSTGVLQDIHWSMGAFGYFPTYTLGNLYAAQLFETMKEELDDVNNMIEEGNWNPLLDWLRKNIHEKGRLYNPSDLIKKATGKIPSSGPFLKYLNEKYSKIYGF
mgnify:FL=1